MPPLAVDPSALNGAGTAVGGIGDGLAAAVGTLTSGFGANTGQDAAGEAFGLAYQDSAKSLLKAAAAGINACRRVGFLVQGSASNYSKAEAASTLGGGAAVLPTPTEPGEFAAPGAPWTLGPGEPEPVLWAVVEAFVGDLWPNGNPAQMHAAATCWRTFGAALRGVKDSLNGPNAVVGAQQMPERAQIEQQFSKLGTDMAGIGAQCDNLAKGLDDFADQVAHAQNAIRDLLHRLGSVSGLWHEVVEVFKGHGLDEVKKIANDIKAVLQNLKGEAQAREQMLRQGMEMLDGAVVGFEAYTRKQITHFLGERVGNPVATVFDTFLNAQEGLTKDVVGLGQGLEQINPLRFAYDPQGAAQTWKDMTKTGLINHFLNPQEAAQADKELAKGLLHLDDWRRDRPGLGAAENLGDIAMFFIPGGGAAGAGARGTADAADAVGAAGAAGKAELESGEAATVGRGTGEAGGVMGRGGALGEIPKTTGGLTTDLDNVGKDLPKPDPAAGGRPAGLPPPGPGEPPVGSAPHPVEPAPSPPGPRELPAQAGDRIPVPAADNPPAPAAPGRAEPPIGPREPAPIGPGPAAGSAQEPAPVFVSQHPASSPAVPAQPVPPPGAGLGPAARVPIMSDPPAQPTLASAHSPQSAPISPPRGPSADSYPGAHPPEPQPPHGPAGPGGGGDGHGGGGDGSGGTGDHGGRSGSDEWRPFSGEGRDPVHSPEKSGEGWESMPVAPRDPYYGEPLPDHWEYEHNPVDPDRINSDVAKLIKDPEAPFGRDPQGHAYFQHEYEVRFNTVGPEGQHWYKYASDDGALADSKVGFSDLEQYKKYYGEQLDRIGEEDGRYLAVVEDGQPASWEQRSLHVDQLGKPYYSYVIDHLPERWKIEVSEIEPAVGQPGGALQVRILNLEGKPVPVEDLVEYGILR